MPKYANYTEIMPFRIKKRKGVKLGAFFFIRHILSFKASGNLYKESIFIVAQIIISFAALPFDIIVIAVWFILSAVNLLRKKGFKFLGNAFGFMLKSAFGKMISLFLTALAVLFLYNLYDTGQISKYYNIVIEFFKSWI